MLLSFFGAFAWMIRRTDAQFERMDGRISGVGQGLEQRLGERITAVERELVEVKVGLARLEGPPRHLLSAR